MIRHLRITACLMAMACAPTPPAGDGIPVHGGIGTGCDAAPAQALVGQPASVELAARAQKLSGARVVRWLRPNQAVTMEYLADRLNIALDEANIVSRIGCG
jgi:hypothetical protein